MNCPLIGLSPFSFIAHPGNPAGRHLRADVGYIIGNIRRGALHILPKGSSRQSDMNDNSLSMSGVSPVIT